MSGVISFCVMARKRETTLRKFGRSLAELRLEADLTQEQLAERSGLHPNYIGDLERGERNPTLMTLLALSDGFRCPLSELIKRSFT